MFLLGVFGLRGCSPLPVSTYSQKGQAGSLIKKRVRARMRVSLFKAVIIQKLLFLKAVIISASVFYACKTKALIFYAYKMKA